MANHANNARMIGRTTPAKHPQAQAETQLLDALEGYLQDSGRDIGNLATVRNVPEPGFAGFHDTFRNPNKYASSGLAEGTTDGMPNY